MSLGATNKNVGFAVSQEKKKEVKDVDIHLIDDTELKERITFLRNHYLDTTKAQLEELALFILTGCPF